MRVDQGRSSVAVALLWSHMYVCWHGISLVHTLLLSLPPRSKEKENDDDTPPLYMALLYHVSPLPLAAKKCIEIVPK